MFENRKLAATLFVCVAIAMTGCTGPAVGADEASTPMAVEESTAPDGEISTFAVDVEGETYQCILYQESAGISSTNPRGYAGMSCHPLESSSTATETF